MEDEFQNEILKRFARSIYGRGIVGPPLSKEQQQKSLEWDADVVMEQIQMQESSHRRMSALVEYQLEYPDMTIREFFAMASEVEDQDEEEED